MEIREKLEILIGLEVHITLKSQKKIFNWGNNYSEEILPNSEVSQWELGYLGTLPIINPETIELALKLAAALRMKINPVIIFDRKLYPYFDLPKGYQITQYRQPMGKSGCLPIIMADKIKSIPLQNLQLEEDTAKSFYKEGSVQLDFNRAGNPLVELTTEPVFHQLEEVIFFLKQLQILLKYLEISEARMERGQLRVDLNFSLKLANDYQTPRYEIKNLNSLNNIEKSLKYEISKHQQLFQQKATPPSSQTLGFNEEKQITFIQREKTNYFYLPEVNIPLIKLKKTEISQVKKKLPLLPWEWWERLTKNDVSIKQANLIIEKPLLMQILNFLEKKRKLNYVEVNDWIVFLLNYLLPHFSQEDFSFFSVRWITYFKLFQKWKEKELDKEEINMIIEKLLTTQYNLPFLINKHKKKKTKVDNDLIEKRLEEIWEKEQLTKEDYLLRSKKIQNYFLGQLKKQFPDISVQELISTIEKFLFTRK